MHFDYKQARAKISGESLQIVGTVNVNVTGGSAQAAVSGQTIYLPNDGINNVAKISGEVVGSILRNSAGTVINAGSITSDAYAAAMSLDVNSRMFGYHRTNNTWARAEIVTPVSGEGFRLLVATSGQKIGGWPNDGVNNVVSISGQNIYNYGSSISANTMVSCVNTSGGTALPNIPCVKAYVRSMSGNDVMFVGGVGAQAPFSGKGLELYGGEVLPVEVNNTNAIQIMSVVNNQKVSIMAVAA